MDITSMEQAAHKRDLGMGETLESCGAPAAPMPNATPDALESGTLLVRLGDTFDKSPACAGRNRKPLIVDDVAQEFETLLNSSDVRLVRMFRHFRLYQRLVDDSDGLTQFPPRGCQNDPIVHETGVKQARLFHRFVQFRQVQRP